MFRRDKEFLKMGKFIFLLLIIITRIREKFPVIITNRKYKELISFENENEWLREKLESILHENKKFIEYKDREKTRKINQIRKQNNQSFELLIDYEPFIINEKPNDSGLD